MEDLLVKSRAVFIILTVVLHLRPVEAITAEVMEDNDLGQSCRKHHEPK